jgi:Zn ribbon nucleic-acid-binding protein
MKHIHDLSYYIDLYDLLTIKECLRTIESSKKPLKSDPEKGKKKSPYDTKKINTLVVNIIISFKKGERYKEKSSTIREWMEEDRRKDEFVAHAIEPANTRCSNCGERMKSTSRDLYDLEGSKMRVLFFFECPACQKSKGIFDNGDEYVSKSSNCPQCDRKLTVKYKREGNVVTRIRKCGICKFSDTNINDFDAQEAEWKKKQQEDKELLKKYRDEFCLTDKEGKEYIFSTAQLERTVDLLGEKEKRENDPAYKKAMKIKKLKIGQLKEIIVKAIEKEGYQDLSFEKPEMGKFVTVKFSVNDMKDERGEYDSRNNLKKLVRSTLDGTNWRLMSDGISYRLGILTGGLKAYEGEEDLIKLVK